MARRSTWGEPQGTQMMMRGLGLNIERGCTILMNCLSICSVTVKSAITPSFIGRIASMLPGTLPSMALASLPTAWMVFLPWGPPSWRIATTDGSFKTIPCPRATISVLAVPKSIARSVEKYRRKAPSITVPLRHGGHFGRPSPCFLRFKCVSLASKSAYPRHFYQRQDNTPSPVNNSCKSRWPDTIYPWFQLFYTHVPDIFRHRPHCQFGTPGTGPGRNRAPADPNERLFQHCGNHARCGHHRTGAPVPPRGRHPGHRAAPARGRRERDRKSTR